MESDAVQAASIRSAVAGLPGVAGMSSGDAGLLGTFTTEQDVAGVRVDDEHVEVHIVAHYGIPLQETALRIRDAVSPLLEGRPLEVSVQDILLPGEQLPDAPDRRAAQRLAVTSDDEADARRRRRVWIRENHPDHGGDPEQFTEGLRAYGSGIPDLGSKPAVHRTRPFRRSVRRLRRRVQGIIHQHKRRSRRVR